MILVCMRMPSNKRYKTCVYAVRISLSLTKAYHEQFEAWIRTSAIPPFCQCTQYEHARLSRYWSLYNCLWWQWVFSLPFSWHVPEHSATIKPCICLNLVTAEQHVPVLPSCSSFWFDKFENSLGTKLLKAAFQILSSGHAFLEVHVVRRHVFGQHLDVRKCEKNYLYVFDTYKATATVYTTWYMKRENTEQHMEQHFCYRDVWIPFLHVLCVCLCLNVCASARVQALHRWRAMLRENRVVSLVHAIYTSFTLIRTCAFVTHFQRGNLRQNRAAAMAHHSQLAGFCCSCWSCHGCSSNMLEPGTLLSVFLLSNSSYNFDPPFVRRVHFVYFQKQKDHPICRCMSMYACGRICASYDTVPVFVYVNTVPVFVWFLHFALFFKFEHMEKSAHLIFWRHASVYTACVWDGDVTQALDICIPKTWIEQLYRSDTF
jgi:hypothetical protein